MCISLYEDIYGPGGRYNPKKWNKEKKNELMGRECLETAFLLSTVEFFMIWDIDFRLNKLIK
jgi:hypothetical protein